MRQMHLLALVLVGLCAESLFLSDVILFDASCWDCVYVGRLAKAGRSVSSLSLRLTCDFIHANCLMEARTDFGTGFSEVDLAKVGVTDKGADA